MIVESLMQQDFRLLTFDALDKIMPKDTLYLLPVVTCISVVAILAQFTVDIILHYHRPNHTYAYLSGSCKIHKFQGAKTIQIFMSCRLLGCLILSALSLFCDKFGKCLNDTTTTVWLSPHGAESLAFLYTSVLAAISLTSAPWGHLATRHDIILLLSILGVYVYRDLWPLVTYNMQPIDIAEGWVLWVKFIVLLLISLGIPLFVPREYIPVDPDNPMEIPNPEQTACLMSLMVYAFLDPIIFMAYKLPHLPYTLLPPVADYDRSEVLKSRGFPHLDLFCGARKRHLFFGLMRVYRLEIFILSLTIIGQVIATFVTPIGVNRLLTFLERNGEGALVYPWFWVAWLFCGPLINCVCRQWYMYITTRTHVRTEGLITQLVFEHSLRIRMKAGGSHDEIKANDDAAIGTPETGSLSGNISDVEVSSAADASPSREAVDTGGASGLNEDPKTTNHTPKAHSSKQPTVADSRKIDNLIGKVNNLVTIDLNNILDGRDFLIFVLQVPLQITCCIFFLYQVLNWSAFVGLGVMLILFPIPGNIIKLVQGAQVEKMKMTDARVQTVTETVQIIRMVKMFAWEKELRRVIEEKREDELKVLWKRKILDFFNTIMNYIIPMFSMLATYATYTVIMKQELNASKVFSSMTIFSLLRLQLQRIFYQLTYIIQAKVSLDRVNDFLQNSELLDSFSKEKLNSVPLIDPGLHNVIGFKDTNFSWTTDEQGSVIPSSRCFKLCIEGELLFKQNCINLIIGPTGSGKTSLLMALLGEMHCIPQSPDSWFNLPRDGGVAYAAQESWVQNETIRENILFGSALDETRYRKVLHQCALERDLEMFDAGDKTEVGERGLTLSGGQKARLTLARAIYSSSSILLLDDILAALDVHTASWIIEKCLQGDLVRERTVLLVSHNVELASSLAEFVVSIDLNGIAKEVTKIASLVANMQVVESELREDVQEDKVALENSGASTTQGDGKLIVAEEIAQGHVSWKSMKLFLTGLGDKSLVSFLLIWVSGIVITDWTNTFQVWYLGYWGSQYSLHDPWEVRVSFYLLTYSLLLLFATSVYCADLLFYVASSLKASRTIHRQLIKSVLGTTLRWLDETPTSRVIARCTQDIRNIDDQIPQSFFALTEMGISVVGKLGAVVLFTPLFFLPGVFVGVLGTYASNVYLRAQLSVKREMSNARSPLLAHFSAAITGLTSIRAYGAQQAFKVESLRRINHYTRVARMSYNLNRWISVRIDVLGALFTTSLASYLLYSQTTNPVTIGFSLNMSVEFCSMILWWVREYNEFEVQSNSLERIQGYIDIEQEPKILESGKPPAAWPTSGDLQVNNLSARYSPYGPWVLKDLSFHIRSGERIGVVGRTGSGKSSLTLSLLRCIYTEGSIHYDGINIANVNLDSLRTSITLIPQIPELLSGSLRRNLDPFSNHDDALLNDALRAAGLFSLQNESLVGDGRITLDSHISSGGSSLSVGQRQIIALARAIVRESKLLILDEATSAIDYKTDAIIQSTLRNELRSDVSIITIAHRLQTVMDANRIMVLDSGKIIEFDTPKNLLQRKGGMLKSLVDESVDREVLYSMTG